MRTFLLTYGRLQRDWLLRDLLYLTQLVDGNLQTIGEFLEHGFAAEFLHHFPAGAYHLVDVLDHVHWHAYRACLIGDGARNRLTYPPRGIGRELVAAAPFELLRALHEADVAFLDQIQELQTVVGVLLGDG